MDQKEKQMEQLYDLVVKSKTGGVPAPKRSLFSTKCPKCGSKLRKESGKLLIFVGETGTKFASRVAKDAELEPGPYNLSITHYKCNCGYEFARSDAEAVSD